MDDVRKNSWLVKYLAPAWRERGGGRERERERQCVCVKERERERERVHPLDLTGGTGFVAREKKTHPPKTLPQGYA